MTPPPAASAAETEAAKAYEDLHVPALFRQWAPRLVEAARVGAGDRVLDVACGTGVLAREVATRVGSQGLVAGLDVDAGMLALARSFRSDVLWHRGRAEALPWADAAFDVVVSQFGLMFFPDPHRALSEMLRVLVPGGRLAIAVWAALDETEVYPETIGLLEELAGPRAARALRAPFALGDAESLARMAEAAGAAAVEVETRRGQAHFPSLRSMVEAELRGWLPIMGVVLTEALIDRVLAAAESRLAGHVAADGALRFAAPALLLTARRSAPSA